ncbi:ankyrin repeat domain-containing protein [Arcobacter sp. LA11]|uniref:ankyrin repeat domain-containing protein n=1 Tax=Arcobacter sp. LA11 TaxID=1898176 RepID=UPI000933C73B|nr:ankyrin repeat domain-containing protein [Arcobacter sp. LA11]
MIRNLFKKITADDVLEELAKPSIKESKIKSMLEHININHKNQNLQTFLHLIITQNHIESVKWLLNNNINYNAVDIFGDTAIILASKYGYTDTITALLKRDDINVDYEDHNRYTAIDFAILNNHFGAYKKLKPRIHNINKRNKENQTILHLAIKAENYKVIDDIFSDPNFDINNELLFYQYSYINKTMLNKILSKFDNLNIKDSMERNILFYVVQNGSECEDIFNSLINRELDIDCIDKKGNNILLHLINYILKKEEIFFEEEPEDLIRHKNEIANLINFIPVILERNTNTFICNNKNDTILSLPAKANNLDILNILFEYEVHIDIQNRDKETALSTVITKGTKYSEVIYLLLDYGASANIKDKNGQTVIEKLIDAILIVKNGKKAKNSLKRNLDFNTDYATVLETVLYNTDVNLSLLNSKEEPYIFETLRYGNIDLLKVLVKHGADINQTDIDSNNIIYKYMEENKTFKKDSQQKEYHNNLQTIIMMGANVNAKDSYGGITLHKAILDCNMPTIKLLLHSGADMHAIDNKGRNIVHNSIWKNDIKVFKLIYSYNKTLLNEPDKFGVLAINYAAFLGYTTLVLELIELGAYINNPYKKNKYILNFLKKFHKNIKPLKDEARTKAQKAKIKNLIDNMKEEFNIEN